MGEIRVLAPELASQIAAGEVVERPASVVKELIENSLDAGATRCDVEIAGGGVTLIAVSDDGRGIAEEDAALALERHATSKLSELADLGRLASFGFRGEALPSIASVSRLTLQSRATGAEAGVEVRVEAGSAAETRPLGAPVGTRVEVRDLFFNVPARRKFLRSSGTESGHVTDVLEAAALSHPAVTFSLTRDGRRVRELLRAPSRAERVRQLLPDEELAECSGSRGPLAVEAFLSRPERARSGAAGLRFLVNGRPIRDRSIAVTVAQAYGSVLERGRYPRGVVYLALPPELVDVNVHPQKAEVRFADPRALTDALFSLLSRSLSQAFSLPSASRAAWGRSAAPNPAPAAAPAYAVTPIGGQAEGEADAEAEAAAPDMTNPNATFVSGGAPPEPLIAVHDSTSAPLRPRPDVSWSALRFIAQVRMTYMLCEGEDGLYVLDQHAAAERVNFDRLRRQYRDRQVSAQSLLFPVTIEVSPEEAELLALKAEEVGALGIEVRVRGSNTVSVHAVPRLLSRASPERLLRELLHEMSRSGGRGFSDAIDLALATMACHGAIRAGDALGPEAAQSLLRALDSADFAGHCPHGRPVVTFTSWAELERRVGRR